MIEDSIDMADLKEYGLNSDNALFDVFISYKVENLLLVRQVAEQLIASNIEPWFDEYRILLDNYKTLKSEIQNGINKSRCGLIFVSNYYTQSKDCLDEYNSLLRKCGHDRLVLVILEEEGIDYTIIKKNKWSFSINGINLEF